MNCKVKTFVGVAWVTAGQGMFAPALPAHQRINLHRGRRAWKKCKCGKVQVCVSDGLCRCVDSWDFPESCAHSLGSCCQVRLAKHSTGCTVCIAVLGSSSEHQPYPKCQASAAGMSSTEFLKQFWVLFSSSAVAASQK